MSNLGKCREITSKGHRYRYHVILQKSHPRSASPSLDHEKNCQSCCAPCTARDITSSDTQCSSFSATISMHRCYTFTILPPVLFLPAIALREKPVHHCGSPLDIREISCGSCRSLRPLPENVNYLSLFGFPSTPPFEFDLDLGKLRKEYLKMMSKVHPDSITDKSEVSFL